MSGFEGHRHYGGKRCKPAQAPKTQDIGEHMGRRADGGPVLAVAPANGEGYAKFKAMQAERKGIKR